ncbi:MAG TPA: ERCC4 domain-containing protein [Patescibacteria group bacterium]|nr:ERCC4 domain-containing protein [Patescibacteria group bacterium]
MKQQKPIFNIFSKKIPREKKKEESMRVIADYRERGSLVISELKKLGLDVEIKELKVADYLIGNIAIERKTVSDFISSMLSHRLLNQLEELQQYENRLLIIEGTDEQELYSETEEGINSNAIRGFLLSIVLKHKVPIIFSKNSEDTAKFIERIAKKKERESPLNVKKRSLDKKERLQFILEGFPGIGPKTARKLLERFKTLKNIMNASEEELKELIGKKADIFRLVDENY